MQINPHGSFLRNIAVVGVYVCVNDAIDTLGDRCVCQSTWPNKCWLKKVFARSFVRSFVVRCHSITEVKQRFIRRWISLVTNSLQRLWVIFLRHIKTRRHQQSLHHSFQLAVSTSKSFQSAVWQDESDARRDAKRRKERRNLLNRPIRDENIDECFTKLLMQFTNLIHQSDDESRHSSPSGR